MLSSFRGSYKAGSWKHWEGMGTRLLAWGTSPLRYISMDLETCQWTQLCTDHGPWSSEKVYTYWLKNSRWISWWSIHLILTSSRYSPSSIDEITSCMNFIIGQWLVYSYYASYRWILELMHREPGTLHNRAACRLSSDYIANAQATLSYREITTQPQTA